MAEVNQREQSSGNIFADLNIPEPSLYLAKAQLAKQILTVIRERNLTQIRNADALPVVLRRSARMRCATDILDIDQPEISALTRGNLDEFSSDRLFKFLNLLGQNIEIVVRPLESCKSKSRD